MLNDFKIGPIWATSKRWAQRLRDGEFVIDNRVIEALECYAILEKVGQFTPEPVE
jgi:hypothetical protein